MIETTDGHKYTCVHVTQELWLELIQRTYDGIVSKINACKKFSDYPEHNTVVAGLYMYAIEEFGKLLILKDSRRLKSSNKREIIYGDRFANHDEKFKQANLYLNNSNHEKSLLLNTPSFSSKSFSGQSFNVNEVIADQIARLTVFYSDLDEVGSEYKVTQTSVVNEQALKDAISDFSNVIEDFKKQLPTKHSHSSNKHI